MYHLLELYFITPILLLAWVLWAILRPFVAKSSFDNVQGPPPPSNSFIGGVYVILPHHLFPADLSLEGHFPKIFHSSQGWSFNSALVERYGGLVKIRGLFGVCPTHTLPMIECKVQR